MEVAIGMLLLVPLFLVLVEATKAIGEYSQLQNAAMEGARMLARQNGDTTNVEDYVRSLLKNADASSALDGAAPTVTISPRDAQNNVTVQVDHEFTPFYSGSGGQGANGLFDIMGQNPLTLSARTTMALPAGN